MADAQNIHFEDALFDVVISESINTFLEDKERAVSECVRVTKPGGYVRLNEETWIKTPPPKELVKFVSRTWGGAKLETSNRWEELLEGSGLTEIVARTYRINTRSEAKNIIRRYGLMEILSILYRTLRLYIRNPAYRSFLKEVREVGPAPENLDEYLGYGLYVGRK